MSIRTGVMIRPPARPTMEATAHAPVDMATIPAYTHMSGATADSMTKPLPGPDGLRNPHNDAGQGISPYTAPALPGTYGGTPSPGLAGGLPAHMRGARSSPACGPARGSQPAATVDDARPLMTRMLLQLG